MTARSVYYSSTYADNRGLGCPEGPPALQRDVSVLLWRILVALALKTAQGGNQLGPGHVRLDDLIDIAATGGHERISQLVAELGHLLGPQRIRVLGSVELTLIENVHRAFRPHHRDLGLNASTSNLCSEITLPTGRDHLGNDRTAVCCLSSLNLEKWDEWNSDKQFIEDVMRFLDNVLVELIELKALRSPYCLMSFRCAELPLELQESLHSVHTLIDSESAKKKEEEAARSPASPLTAERSPGPVVPRSSRAASSSFFLALSKSIRV